MIKKLLPLVLLFIGAGAGIGAGMFLRPEPEPVEASAEDAEKAKVEAEDKEDEGTIDHEYFKMSNQFVVPVIKQDQVKALVVLSLSCLLYTSPSPRDLSTSRMPSSA